jgi:hypothetical protein
MKSKIAFYILILTLITLTSGCLNKQDNHDDLDENEVIQDPNMDNNDDSQGEPNNPMGETTSIEDITIILNVSLVKAGQPILFTLSEKEIYSDVIWNMGDGTICSGEEVTHFYYYSDIFLIISAL